MSIPPPSVAPEPTEAVALDDPADAWTVGSAVLAFVLVFAVAGVAAVVILGLSGSTGDGELRPGAAQVATLMQDVAMLAVPFLIASALAVRRARARDFGLRAIAPRRLVASVLVTFGGFFAFSVAYAQLVSAEGSQDTLFTLGAERGGLLLISAAVLVIVFAPVVEEFLFRGFMYRAARNRLGSIGAALFVGGLFGIVHLTDAETVPLIPMLAVLGAVSCVLYERTGSLAAPIGLHVLNNTIAFSAAADVPDAATVGVPLGLAMLTALVVTAAITSRREREAPSPAPG